ncbi:MAG: MFS transporter [Lentisphaeria bacterium]|nr:MFS transporter [Lentisphaeria bacterium]
MIDIVISRQSGKKGFDNMSILQEIFKKKQAFWLFVPLLLLYSTSYFQRTALPGTIYDTLLAELDLTAVQMANLGAAFVYPYAIFQLVSGMLVDRFCGTRVVCIGGLVFLAGVFLFPLSENLYLLYTARSLTGIGASTMYLSLVRETDRLFGRKNYAVMFGIAYFCGYSGGLMGSLPFEWLTGLYPWRHVLLGAAVISAAAYLGMIYGKKRIELPPIPKTPVSFAPFRHILGNPLSWLIIFCANVNFCTYFIIQTFFGKKFLEDFAGFSSKQAAAVIFALTLVCMFTMLTTSIFTRLSGNRRRPLVLLACGLCALSSVLMVAAIYFRWNGWCFGLIYCMFAAAAGVPPIFSMVMQELNSRDIIAQSSAVSNMFGYLSVAVGAQLIGLLLDCFEKTKTGDVVTYSDEAYLTLFIIIAVIAVVSFVFSLRIPETKGHYLRLHVNTLHLHKED